MKILQVISKFYYSGAENLVFNLAPLMKQDGNSVTVLALYKNSDINEQNELTRKLEMQGIEVFVLETPQSRLSLITKLRYFIKNGGYTIIHSHAFQPNFYSRIAAAFLKVPVIITYHSASNDWNSTRAIMGEKLADLFTAKRVSVSTIPINFYRSHISTKKEIHEIPNGIVLKNYSSGIEQVKSIRAHLGIPDEAIFLLNVGRIVKQKGQLILIEALNKLKEQGNQNIYLAIAGFKQDLVLTKELQDKAIQYYLNDNIKLLGSRSDVDALLEACDIFVFPSIEEAHPIALIEAANAKKPIIASSIEANLSAFSDKSIFFSPVGDPESLASTIKYVSNNLKLGQVKGENAKIETLKKYDIKITAQKYLKLFTTIHKN